MWSLPGRLLAAVLATELLAVVLIAFEISVTSFSVFAATAIGSGTLVAGGVLHAEVSLRVERVRRRIGLESAQIDLTSVWTFAAALLLPPAVASAVVVALLGFLYLRVWRTAGSPLYRHSFSAATIVLAVHAAAALNAHIGGAPPGAVSGEFDLLAVIAALLGYTVVNTCLVVGVVVVSSDRSVREMLGHGDEVILEVATLCLGALVALAMVGAGPWLVLMVLPPVLVLHRAVLVRTLQEAVDTDGKTGLLTAAAWQRQAMRLVGQGQGGGGTAAVLVLDLDHFKRVNDLHGHLAGDAVLRAVATAVRAEVRDQDLVGRFGGEEFLILLPRAVTPTAEVELRRIAERIRRGVSGLTVEIPTPDGPLTISGLSVSIGVARFPEDGVEVPELVAVADSALYEAKRSGRNTVRFGHHPRRFEHPVSPPEVSGNVADSGPPSDGPAADDPREPGLPSSEPQRHEPGLRGRRRNQR